MTREFHVRLCVQRKLACSAGERPAGARVRSPVVWIAGWRETKTLKPIDNVSLGKATSHRAVTTVNAKVASKVLAPKAEPTTGGRRQHGEPKSDRCGSSLRRGGSDSTVARTSRATGEALLVPARNRRSKVGRITGKTGKSAEDERVAAGSAVARKRRNVRGAKGPCHLQRLQHREGKDEMTKASIDLQDLRRRIYVKAKAEPSWRFWGLYVHVCKMETLRAAYEIAKQNDSAPGVDGVTLEAIEAQGGEALLEQLRDELTARTYTPLPTRRQEIPKDGGSVRVLSIPAIRDRVLQGALKLILEPVFEADFQPGSFGYRPKQTAHEAIKRVAEAIVQRKTRVLDFDLRAYFDNVRHDRLLEKVAQRVEDGVPASVSGTPMPLLRRVEVVAGESQLG